MSTEADVPPHALGAFLARVRALATPRSWAFDANDGVMTTAGLLEGFAGAGATDPVLLTAATAMLIAGSLSLGAAKWSEAAAERDAERAAIAAEAAELAADPANELAELARYWEGKGLDGETAHRVAEQLSARDALAAQLEFEHGITQTTAVWEPWWIGATAGLAFVVGALAPLLVTILLPGAIERWVIVAAVLVSLVLTSWVAAHTSHISVRRMVVRSLTVGIGTVALSYVVGSLLF